MAEVEGGNTAPRSVDDIQLVPSLVAVRRRPHMYFGHQNEPAAVIGTLVSGAMHDWSRNLDVLVRVLDDRSAEVIDNGAGLSTAPVGYQGTSFLESMVTELHAGAPGWMAAPCAAVSERFEIETVNGDGRWLMATARGDIVEALKQIDHETGSTGTQVRFTIDPDMFVGRVIPSGHEWLAVADEGSVRGRAQHNPRATLTLHDLRSNDGPVPVERPAPVELEAIADETYWASDLVVLLRHIDYRWELDRPSGDHSATDRSRRLLAAAGDVLDSVRSIDPDLGESALLVALADALPERLDRDVVVRLALAMAQSA